MSRLLLCKHTPTPHTNILTPSFPSVTLLSQQSAPVGVNTEPYIRTANPNSGLMVSNETHMHDVCEDLRWMALLRNSAKREDARQNKRLYRQSSYFFFYTIMFVLKIKEQPYRKTQHKTVNGFNKKNKKLQGEKQTNKRKSVNNFFLDAFEYRFDFFQPLLLFMNMPIHIYIPFIFLSLYTISSVIHYLDSFPKEGWR